MNEQKRIDAVRWWGLPSRHRPRRRSATADTAHRDRHRIYFPGPRGEVKRARNGAHTGYVQPSTVFAELDDLGSPPGGPQGVARKSG